MTEPSRPVRMCVWRIFGVSHDWKDRPAEARSHTIEVVGSPAAGDTAMVVIGDIPNHVLDALKDWRAQLPMVLDATFGGVIPTSERYEEVRSQITLDDVKGGFPLWLTLEVSRSVDTTAEDITDETKRNEMLNSFERAASDYLTVTMARLLGTLGAELRVDQLLFADKRAYLLSDRPAVTVAIHGGSAQPTVTYETGWDALPFGKIEGLLKKGAAANYRSDAYCKAARLLWSALEHEKDTLRRFLFAFVGLEVLANKEGARLREQVAAKLTGEVPDAPLRDLILPDRSDGEPPYRSVQFKFACLATIMSRSTAVDDVALFRTLVKARNGLAHGEVDTDALPASECVELLRKYVSLVAKAT